LLVLLQLALFWHGFSISHGRLEMSHLIPIRVGLEQIGAINEVDGVSTRKQIKIE